VRSSIGVLIRKVKGRATACMQLATYGPGGASALARPSLLQTAGVFAMLLLPLLTVLALTTCAVAAPSLGHLAPIVGVAGVTTGTKSSGTDFVGLNDMLKQVYTKAFENNVEKDSEVADLIKKAEGFDIVDGPDGKQINIGHIFSSGGGVGSMLEDDYLYTPTAPTTKQSAITIKQHVAVVELSGRTLRRVKKGPAAFVTWADKALPMKAQRLAFHKDRQYLGTGTGIMFRYNGVPDGTGDPIDNMFGIAGLDDRAAMLVLRDDNLRAGPNANGTSLRTGTALVGSVDYALKAISTTVAGVANAPTAAADNDYIFLGDANVNGSGAREMMGLEGIIDDGTNVATFQGLARATYPELNGQIIDAAGVGWDGSLSEEILDFAAAQSFERGNMGRPTVLLMNRSGQRSFWKNMKNDRVINDPRGAFTGGKSRLKMILGDTTATLAAARKVPASRAYGIDTEGIHRYVVGKGRWDDTDGDIWNRVVDGTGRKDAFFAVYVEEEELGADNPAGSFKLTNLVEA
jgi:hypothetical protein